MNLKLKGAIVASGQKQSTIANEMGMCTKTFYNKINCRTRHGATVHFTEEQKQALADRFGIATTDIE